MANTGERYSDTCSICGRSFMQDEKQLTAETKWGICHRCTEQMVIAPHSFIF
ncbi:MAG: hypothetical protein ACOX0E_09580 [Syntrophomonadaceae bacterium]|jgi:ribosomal protein S27AE